MKTCREINEIFKPVVLTGLMIAVTGEFKYFGREAIKELIKKNGGHFTDKVNKKTSYVIAGEKPGSKLDKAQSMGISVISEDELLKYAEINEARERR